MINWELLYDCMKMEIKINMAVIQTLICRNWYKILEKIKETDKIKTIGKPVYCIKFAYDITLVAVSKREMNDMLQYLINVLKKFERNQIINSKKT